MIIGQIIIFDLETWYEDEMVMEEFHAEILSICIDPLHRHKSKCIVMLNDAKYGIPFNCVKNVLPAVGEQLLLF